MKTEITVHVHIINTMDDFMTGMLKLYEKASWCTVLKR